MAIPVFLILVGVAEPVFPLGTRASQSTFVLVQKTRAGDPFGFGTVLPVRVLARQWQDAVVPVLEDDRWQVDNPVMAAAIATGPREVVTLLARALEMAFADAGWGP